VSRVLNAKDFLIRIRKIKSDYETLFRGRIDKLRAKYAENPTGQKILPLIDMSLEAHLREYFVNAFLEALNWRLNKKPEEDLPELIPEALIRSSSGGTVKYLDYLGLDADLISPLFIVETKRLIYDLPIQKAMEQKRLIYDVPLKEAMEQKELFPALIARGLEGDNLGGYWNKWLATLRDYVTSAKERSGKVPRRVVITNTNWLVIFIDPADSFLTEGSKNPENILVYEDWESIEANYTDLYRYLEHQLVLNEKAIITIGELLFHIDPGHIASAMHGLRLLYIEVPGHYAISPVIKIVPLVILRSSFGSFLLIEQTIEKEIPHEYEKIVCHLENIELLSKNLLKDINTRLGIIIPLMSLSVHYHDEDIFPGLPGIREIQYMGDFHATKFIVLTGESPHYILKEPKLPDCPYHSWANCRSDDCASNPGPIENRSTEPRSFFKSGENYHCAHAAVLSAKASQIYPENRNRCGSRSGKDFDAFCEIYQFEQYLCCKACAFEEVCSEAEAFILPCN